MIGFFRRSRGTVFLGDSLTKYWEIHSPTLFGPKRINAGVPGQRTCDLLERFDEDVVRVRPKSVHIMGGINDLFLGRHLDEALKDLETMIARALGAKIRPFLGSVTPIDVERAERGALWGPHIAPLNNALRKLAKGMRCQFIDYADALAPDGRLPANYHLDGIHLSTAGYRVMDVTMLAVMS